MTIDLQNLTPEQHDALEELVHEQASQIASDAINEGKAIDFLLGNGWDTEGIQERLEEMTSDDDSDSD